MKQSSQKFRRCLQQTLQCISKYTGAAFASTGLYRGRPIIYLITCISSLVSPLFFPSFLSLNAQNIDSLFTLFSQTKGVEQIGRANEICAIAFRREVVDEEWVFSQNDKAEQIRARVLFCVSSFAEARGDYQKAIAYIEEGLSIDERADDKPMVAADYRKLASIYDRINQVDKAVSCLNNSIDISSSIGDEKNEAETLYQLGMFYLRKNRNEVGLQTIQKVLAIARRIDHQKLIAKTLGSIGEHHLQYGDADQAFEAIRQSLEVCRQIGTPQYLEAGLCRLGMAQMKTGEYSKAESNLLEALEMSKLLEDVQQTAFNLMVLGDLERERKKYREADSYYVQSVDKCLELQNYNMLSVIYDKLYKLHRSNNPDLSLDWLEKGIIVDDSLYNLEMHNQISAFQIEYETEKKEMQITSLQEGRTLMIWFGIAGGAVLLLALATFFSLWRLTVQKKRLAESQREFAEQKIKQLEQEKQLGAIQAVLDGEVKERTRLARDLHDSLGCVLAAAKYNLVSIKQTSALGEKDLECYHKAVGLLDDSINEIRRVAHHLMPDALSRFGLKPAIEDFCDTLPSVRFVWYGDEARLDPKLEEVVYRIIHELISNALKHSDASYIYVQVVQESNRLALIVQDDGIGFDPETVPPGMGLSNIRIRVASFGGIINIDSKAGEGTEIYIEFLLKTNFANK